MTEERAVGDAVLLQGADIGAGHEIIQEAVQLPHLLLQTGVAAPGLARVDRLDLYLLQERKQTMLEPLVVWTNRMTHGAIWNAGLTEVTLALAWEKRAALLPKRFISRTIFFPNSVIP